MFKSLMMLVRGSANDRNQSVIDANSLTILRQQVRDVSGTMRKAKVAEAEAYTEGQRERRRRAAIVERIADLETRAVAAIRQSEDELAHEAAEAIAELEADLKASDRAIAVIDGELQRLKTAIGRGEVRIRDLERGLRLATATRRSTALRLSDPAAPHLATLSEAEETLKHLLDTQEDNDAIAARLDPEGGAYPADRLSRKLADAGCGSSVSKSASSVLNRLKERADKAA